MAYMLNIYYITLCHIVISFKLIILLTVIFYLTRYIQMLELLQELNISGNELRSLPKSLGALSKLVVLRAHSNILSSLPDFHKAKSLRVGDTWFSIAVYFS